MITTVVVALMTGAVAWLVGSHTQSPADAAASHRPPPASLVTVPVENRSLVADVVGQGTLHYGARRVLTMTGTVALTGDDEATQLVTKVPASGSTLREGDVLMEVSGRPVFVLKGSVPMYRKLVRGATGDDVRQVRSAMRRLMPGRGLSSTGPFGNDVIDAVKVWYARKGYTATEPTIEARTQLRGLEQAVAAAKSDGGQALSDARADLRQFRVTYGVSVASGEVLFLPRLPVRVGEVFVRPGDPATGKVAAVTDSVLVFSGSVAVDDAELLHKNMKATLKTLSGQMFPATLTGKGAAVASPLSDSGSSGGGGDSESGSQDESDSTGEAEEFAGTPIRVRPSPAKKLAKYSGESVKVIIRVGSTAGPVLSVPTAAVFTSADGHARVSVQDPTGRTKDIPVETGLSAGGYVQVTPAAGARLSVGDRVAVGRP